jgi:CRISPR system Cascade subunit CasC
MNDPGVKIEVHLIQNFAPSNLNRDDTGQPKSATFGGFRRARISSQCGKRAARNWWRERGTVTVGERTKRLQQLIADRMAQDNELMKKIADDEDRKAGIRIFTDAYYSAADTKKPDSTKVLIFIGPDEVDVCVRAIRELWDDKPSGGKRGVQKGIASIVREARDLEGKKGTSDDRGDAGEQPDYGQEADEEATEGRGGRGKPKRPALATLKEIEDRIRAARVSADIALFGRMLAERPGRNTDGACQVAHPISTHRVDMEMDFYTAMDDLNLEGETGAGMMGVVGFNSACYYRYALVDRDQLARNLARKTDRQQGQWSEELTADDYTEADKVIKAFLEAMVYAIPTGKQNSFAAQNLPSFGLFVRRQDGVAVSLANAFCKPVRATKKDDDLVGLSVDALTDHWGRLQKVYGEQGVRATACFHVAQDNHLNDLSGCDEGSVEKAIDAVMRGV